MNDGFDVLMGTRSLLGGWPVYLVEECEIYMVQLCILVWFCFVLFVWNFLSTRVIVSVSSCVVFSAGWSIEVWRKCSFSAV